MKLKSPFCKLTWGAALFVIAQFGVATAAEAEQKSVAVRHPNLLLTPLEIEQVKLKVRDQPWAARLLDRVKAKAAKDNALIENALSYALTGERKYATHVRNQLVREAREQMPH